MNNKNDPASSEHTKNSKTHGRAKKSFYTPIWVLVVLLLILLGLIGVIGRNGFASINTTASTPITPSPAPVAPQAPPAHVGATISVKDQNGNPMDVTLVKIFDPATGADNLQPDSGKRFVGVQFKITNTGTNPLSDDPDLNVMVYDDMSRAYNVSVYPLVDCQKIPSNMKLSAGSSALGCEEFTLPIGAKLTKFQYTPSAGSSSSTGEWLIP